MSNDRQKKKPSKDAPNKKWIALTPQNFVLDFTQAAPNLGLVYERYPRIWESGSNFAKSGENNARFLEEFAECQTNLCYLKRSKNYINLIKDRQRSIVNVHCKDDMKKLVRLSFSVSGRMMTGMGNPNPMENGFRFDSYGLPFLPGSGVKGLARVGLSIMAKRWQVEKNQSPEEYQQRVDRVFGWQREDRGQSGSIIFLDAYCEKAPEWAVDVLTPHYPDYYRETVTHEEQVPPGDWMSPTPVSFLALQNATFICWLLPVDSSAEESLADLEFAREALCEGLRERGIGAKRSAGYGYVSQIDGCDSAPTRNLLKIQLRQLTPLCNAGAKAGTQDPLWTIRPATLRGILRFWFRALVGTCLKGGTNKSDKQEKSSLRFMRALEAEIFGSAGAETGSVRQRKGTSKALGGRSKLRVLPTVFPKGKCINNDVGYLGYGLTHVRVPGAELELVLQLDVEAQDFAFKGKLVLAALWCWLRFGGTGSRARRGFGCFSALEEPNLSEDIWRDMPGFVMDSLGHRNEQIKAKLNDELKSVLRRVSKLLQENAEGILSRMGLEEQQWSDLEKGDGVKSFSTFTNYYLGVMVGEKASSAFDLFFKLNDMYNDFRIVDGQVSYDRKRQYKKEHEILIEFINRRRVINGMTLPRVAFGLPLRYYFKDFYGYKRAATVDVTAEKMGNGQKIQKWERRGSPLFLRVSEATEGYIAIGLYLAADFLPEGAKLRLELNKNANKDRKPITGHCSLPDGKLIEDFLDAMNKTGY